MNANAYELLALCMRYVFAAIMALILLRAWKITLVDGQRATKLRRLSPETGIVGEFLVIDGHERSRNGMHYPVILEGTIGSDRRNDIRLRSSSVRRRHAIFQMTGDGLFVRGHAGGKLRDGFGRVVKEITLRDGDFVTIGGIRLMLVLSGAQNPHESPAERKERRPHSGPMGRRYEAPPVEPGISREGEDLFEVATDRIPRRAAPRHSNDLFEPDSDGDVFYDYDEYDDC